MEVRNNLQEQLSRFRNTTNSAQRINTTPKKGFTFKRLSLGELPSNEARRSSYSTRPKPSKPTATVAPVTSVSQPRPFAVPKTTPTLTTPTQVSTSPTCIVIDHSPIRSPPLKTNATPTNATPTDEAIGNEGAELTVAELRDKRLKVMDDICEILNEVPASVISTLFGASSGYLQKKLAMRRKLLSQETNLMKTVPKSSPILTTPPAPCNSTPISLQLTQDNQSCDDHMTTADIYDKELEEWEEIEDDEEWAGPMEEDQGYNPSYPLRPDNTGPLTSSPTNITRPSIDPPDYTRPPTNIHTTTNVSNTSFTTRPPTNITRPTANITGPPSYTPPPSSSTTCALTRDNSKEFSSSSYPHSSSLVNIFKSVFGLRQFRPKQLEAVNAAVLSKDCFVLMPTGGGKSLCYQLPALVVEGVTVVVSPLRSLIQDQVQKLCSLEIAACHLSGDISQSEELTVYTELSRREPGMKLLYVTPEKLVASQKLTSAIQSLFTRHKLARFVIDEAHCISSWGHDFRPDYKRLSQLRNRFPGVPMMALTATATPRVQADILNQLNMSNTKWFTQSFNRTNLTYSVVPKRPKKVNNDIVELILNKFQNQSGIVYCLSRRDCEVVSGVLNQSGVPAVAYHAGLEDQERIAVQNKWLRDANCKVVCATIAFGMGIDKPDVRFVIHHTIPKSVEGYYQESGRAGRDGRPAHCLLYYNYGDMSRIRRLLMMEESKTNLRQNISNLFRMIQFCENESDCRRLQLLEYFAEQFDPNWCKASHTPCDNCQSSTPHSTRDVTELVQLIVHSINSVPSNDQYTLVQHLEALRGGASTRPHLLSLPYHKKGLMLSKHDLERLLHMMVLKSILAEDFHVGNHGNVISYIRPGTSSVSVLSGSYGTILLKVKAKGSVTGSGNVTGPGGSDEDRLKEECYLELKRLRARIALDTGKNPEVIVAVTTLQDMVQKLPASKTDMLNVQGMTEAKWKNSRGEEFLKLTSEYAIKRATVSQQPAEHRSPYFGTKENCNPGTSSGRSSRKRVKPSGVNVLSKTSNIAQTVDTTLNDSEDEFETSIVYKKTKRIVSKQSKLPGFLSVPNTK